MTSMILDTDQERNNDIRSRCLAKTTMQDILEKLCSRRDKMKLDSYTHQFIYNIYVYSEEEPYLQVAMQITLPFWFTESEAKETEDWLYQTFKRHNIMRVSL